MYNFKLILLLAVRLFCALWFWNANSCTKLRSNIIIHNIICSHWFFFPSLYWIFLGDIVLLHSLPWPIKCKQHLINHRQRQRKISTSQVSAIFHHCFSWLAIVKPTSYVCNLVFTSYPQAKTHQNVRLTCHS